MPDDVPAGGPAAMSASGPAAFIRQAQIIPRLRDQLGADCVLDDPEDTRPYECDGLSAYREMPMAVVLPRDEGQLAQALRLCHAMGVPVVPRGAGTGLSGGALPHAQGVLISLARLNRILSIDPLARIARVQPGVRNLAVSEAAAAHGLYYAPDPSSQVACTIGGNVAENSGGLHCLKYGLTVHNVLRVRGLTIEGEPVEFGAESLDSPGADLLALVIGSEGMLAVVTEVSLKLLPRPIEARCAMASFAELEQAGAAVAAIIAAGIIPAGLELMDQPATRAVEEFVHAGYDTEAAAILLCEVDGTPEEVAEQIERVRELLQSQGATAMRVSQTEAERLRLWAGRKAAFPAVGRISPDYYCMDGTIPRRRLGELLGFIGQMERKYGLRCPNVFHAGDGNLHPLILFDANQPGELERTEQFAAEVLEKCIAVGGTITGEHGVGIEKINQMCQQFTGPELAWFRALKRAFDEQGLLNPAKNIPSLHRCAEFGRMHVSAGRLPFPDLPRF
jgi:glycolate oxidase